MADVKWIKISTYMFDNRKIKHLRRLPDGDNIVLIWVMLLTIAGRCNANGRVFLTEDIPYTSKMLAEELNFEEGTIQLALSSMEELGMIVNDNDFLYITGWEEHQNVEGMDKIREQNRLRKQRQREREKELNCDGNVMSRDSHAIEEDKNKIENKNIDTIEYNKIMQLYNTLCPSLPSVRSLSESRKKAIRARMHTYTVDDFKKLFEKAEASDFLKGANDRNWSATFDWLIKDANIAKVLDGNYNKKKKNGFDNYTGRNYDMANLEKRLVEGGINHE